MNTRYYRLEGRKIIPCKLLEWAQTMENDRRIGFTQCGELEVSTVFLGLDHSFEPGGEPVLWETMVFKPDPDGIGGKEEAGMDRCSGSFEQAEAMHERMVARIRLDPK